MLYLKRNTLTPYLTGSFAILFILISLMGEGGLIKRIQNWQEAAAKNRELFALKKQLAFNTIVLTDYHTHQCFIGCPQLFCVDRLPCYYAKNSLRFYPDNKTKVQELVKPGTYIVVTTQTAANILPWIKEKGFTWDLDVKKDYQLIQLQKN